jgi:hypothetical protein
MTGSGASFEESAYVMQQLARRNPVARGVFLHKVRLPLRPRSARQVLTSPLGGSAGEGFMPQFRIGEAVSEALLKLKVKGELSTTAAGFLQWGSSDNLTAFAEAVVPLGEKATIQEVVLKELVKGHPQSVFDAFAKRLEKSSTLLTILSRKEFDEILANDARDEKRSAASMARLVAELTG